MSDPTLAPFRLAPYFSPRVWGTTDLRPWYDIALSEPVGEAWLTGDASVVETGPLAGATLQEVAARHREQLLGQGAGKDFPLLIKILFPHQKLSVQVHPDDALAAAAGELRGKTECWYVLDAKPGASVSLGLKPGTTLDRVRAAVEDHTLESLLEQVPVERNDMIFVDAGTVHAIGPGVTLLETQQNSDLTYRLYDYGRPRELHVESALRATRMDTAAGKVPPRSREHGLTQVTELIEQRYFAVERADLAEGEPFTVERAGGAPEVLVSISGSATLVASDGEPVELQPGRAVVIPAQTRNYRLQAAEKCAVVRAIPPVERA